MDLELFDKLVNRHLDGGLSAEQQRELEVALQSHVHLRTLFWDIAKIHSQLRAFTQEQQGLSEPALRTEFNSLDSAATVKEKTPLRLAPARRQTQKRNLAWSLMALAAGIAIAALALLPQTALTPIIPNHHAVLHDISNAVWSTDDQWAVGDALGEKHLTLMSGLAQVRFSSGATLILAGPASLSVIDPLHATLHHGRVTVRVPESAHGFVLKTDGLDVVDLGTEFGMTQQLTGENPGVDVLVFEGSVQATAQTQATSLPRIMHRGDASRLSARSSLLPVKFQANGYVRAMPSELIAAQLERDLEVWYRFDETAGTQVLDSSGHGHHGTLQGNTAKAMATAGRINGAFQFNGSSQVVVSNHPNLTLQEFTLHAWIRPQDKQGRDAQILSKQGSYGLALPNNTAMKFYFWHMDRVIDHDFTPSEWVNLIATFDGTVRRFYVNGIRIATITSPAPPISPEPLRLGSLGKYAPNSHVNFRGDIDDIRIYRRALSENDVRLLYLSATQITP